MEKASIQGEAKKLGRPLQPGDLIFSGTPAGVGPIKPGDKLEGHVDGVGDLTVTYKA